ncbi:MAG: hypothetical protein ACE5MG_11760, partial [Candidatus Methylomirabilales bacterium]
LYGCPSHKIVALAAQPIEAYPGRQTVNGVTITAEPFHSKEKSEKAFTVDLTEEGYVPILLVMKNQSKDNILLRRDDIELLDTRGNVVKPMPANVMAEDFEHNKVALAIIGFGIFSYAAAEEANKEMVRDWSDKGLPAEKILMPNRKAHGVLYFKLEKGLATLANSTLHIPVTNLRTGEIYSVKLRVTTRIPVPDVEGTAQKTEKGNLARFEESLRQARSAKPVTPTLRNWLLGEWVGARENPWYQWDATIRITAYDQTTHVFKGDGYLVDKGVGFGTNPSRTDLVIIAVIDEKGRVVMTTHHSSGAYPGSSFTFNLKRERDGHLSGTDTHGGGHRLSLEKK